MSRANVVPFRDPHAPLEGAERAAALERLRITMPGIAAGACDQAMRMAWAEIRRLGFGKLSIEDIVPLIFESLQKEMRRREVRP